MIARIWHGKTKVEDFEAYTDFLRKVAIPDYQNTEGFRGLTFLRRIQNNEGHFNLITLWENLDVVKNFAGQDFEKAKKRRAFKTRPSD